MGDELLNNFYLMDIFILSTYFLVVLQKDIYMNIRTNTQRKKGYQNGAPGVLLLQIVPFFKGASFFPW